MSQIHSVPSSTTPSVADALTELRVPVNNTSWLNRSSSLFVDHEDSLTNRLLCYSDEFPLLHDLINTSQFKALKLKGQITARITKKGRTLNYSRHQHSVHSAILAKTMADKLELRTLDPSLPELLVYSSLLHDIGHPWCSHLGERFLNNIAKNLSLEHFGTINDHFSHEERGAVLISELKPVFDKHKKDFIHADILEILSPNSQYGISQLLRYIDRMSYNLMDWSYSSAQPWFKKATVPIIISSSMDSMRMVLDDPSHGWRGARCMFSNRDALVALDKLWELNALHNALGEVAQHANFLFLTRPMEKLYESLGGSKDRVEFFKEVSHSSDEHFLENFDSYIRQALLNGNVDSQFEIILRIPLAKLEPSSLELLKSRDFVDSIYETISREICGQARDQISIYTTPDIIPVCSGGNGLSEIANDMGIFSIACLSMASKKKVLKSLEPLLRDLKIYNQAFLPNIIGVSEKMPYATLSSELIMEATNSPALGDCSAFINALLNTFSGNPDSNEDLLIKLFLNPNKFGLDK